MNLVDSNSFNSQTAKFRHVIIDDSGPLGPWGKSFGDLNGDGLTDLVIGGQSRKKFNFYKRVFMKLGLWSPKVLNWGELVWYQNPTWEKHLVSDNKLFSTDVEVADVDKDGHNDIIALSNSGIFWFKYPDWKEFRIDTKLLHDVELADLDNDGDLDIVARNQSLFDHNDGNIIHIYVQDSPTNWRYISIPAPHGEGLKIADINGDKKVDIIVNRFWYKNPGTLSKDRLWPQILYGNSWQWADVFIDTADINADGLCDIILSPSEIVGKRYHISWFEAPKFDEINWIEHVIDPDVEAVHHFIGAADFDNDGDLDVSTSEMYQSDDSDEVAIYWSESRGEKWCKEIIATSGSHSMRIVDIDNDGDQDLFGANWAGRYQPIELWENQVIRNTQQSWKRHIIDNDKEWRTLFISAADIDGDNLKDVITGGFWYRNPNNLNDEWQRYRIGSPAENFVLVKDFDNDGLPDIFSSQWKSPLEWNFFEKIKKKIGLKHYYASNRFALAHNNGSGSFTISENIDAGIGDYLQGASVVSTGKFSEIALSWHGPGNGIQTMKIPDNPINDHWKLGKISSLSQDEELSAGDIDGDGDIDLLLGTKWLRNEGDGRWTSFTLFNTDKNPDRNRLIDMNIDGKLDAVVGYEAISTSGEVAWYEQGNDPTQPWTEHPIIIATGPMSIDVADIDNDRDLDIVVGEHNLQSPEKARLLLLENSDGLSKRWITHVIYVGDEHHNGAHAVDIDNDGDKDIISIGWSHNKVILYENLNL